MCFKLQNDRLSLDELGAQLRSVNQTLKVAESTVSRTLAEIIQIIDDKLKDVIQTIQKETQHGVKHIKDETLDCQARIKDSSQDAEHQITKTTQDATMKLNWKQKQELRSFMIGPSSVNKNWNKRRNMALRRLSKQNRNSKIRL
ncbi:hypothetical protein DPMN_021665 [Dreissena polymorpha]|uniref:Uncharacterized protein n=1 Tax=Dreissena polymorpha TaxID=45954 RepID=A0A9D4NPJ2_DREPO|nr:hypothetical protein DPMN_021665 [Dreissena polymorpha]